MWERWNRVSGLEDPVGFLLRTAMNVFRDRARRATLAARRTLGLVAGAAQTYLIRPDGTGRTPFPVQGVQHPLFPDWIPT
jgi:hypothetical protein